jgi:hypothetical protein
LVTVVTIGTTAPLTGASVLPRLLTTGVTVPVTGARVLVRAASTEATVSVRGTRVLAAAVTTGAAVLVARVGADAGGGTDAAGVAGGAVLVALAVLTAEPAGAPEREPEAAGDVAELTADDTGAAAAPTAEVTGDVAEPTTEETVDEAGPTVEVTADVCVEVRGASAAVEAWAGRENSSIITKIPAAASAACIAVRAMRRTTGCDMSSSTRRETEPPARPDLLFGHHRTV